MAIAALLVANSHLEHFYARQWLAGDGLLGNSLFFMLAGYGLVRSEARERKPFVTWFVRRLARLYPSVVLALAVFGLAVGREYQGWHTIRDYAAAFIWPTRFTFVAMVVPFYLLFFPLLKIRSQHVFALTIGAMAVVYLAAYAPDARHMPPESSLQLASRPLLVHASAYFQVMVLGGWLACRPRGAAKPLRSLFLVAAMLFIAYVGAKYVMVTGHGARAYAMLHLLTFLLCWSLFGLLSNESLLRWMRQFTALWFTIALVSGLTLEIYVVHSFIAEYEWVRRPPFPLNIVLFWALTIPLSYGAARLSRPLQALLRDRRQRSTLELRASASVPTEGVKVAPAE